MLLLFLLGLCLISASSSSTSSQSISSTHSLEFNFRSIQGDLELTSLYPLDRKHTPNVRSKTDSSGTSLQISNIYEEGKESLLDFKQRVYLTQSILNKRWTRILTELPISKGSFVSVSNGGILTCSTDEVTSSGTRLAIRIEYRHFSNLERVYSLSREFENQFGRIWKLETAHLSMYAPQDDEKWVQRGKIKARRELKQSDNDDAQRQTFNFCISGLSHWSGSNHGIQITDPLLPHESNNTNRGIRIWQRTESKAMARRKLFDIDPDIHGMSLAVLFVLALVFGLLTWIFSDQSAGLLFSFFFLTSCMCGCLNCCFPNMFNCCTLCRFDDANFEDNEGDEHPGEEQNESVVFISTQLQDAEILSQLEYWIRQVSGMVQRDGVHNVTLAYSQDRKTVTIIRSRVETSESLANIYQLNR